MQIEHLALNLEQAEAAVTWYHRHLGMPIHRQQQEPLYAAFLGEPPGLLEIYCNPSYPLAEPKTWHCLTLHLALTSTDLAADRDRLLAAGASLVPEHCDGPDADGYGVLMLRCPWGLPLQLCRRREPLAQ